MEKLNLTIRVSLFEIWFTLSLTNSASLNPHQLNSPFPNIHSYYHTLPLPMPPIIHSYHSILPLTTLFNIHLHYPYTSPNLYLPIPHHSYISFPLRHSIQAHILPLSAAKLEYRIKTTNNDSKKRKPAKTKASRTKVVKHRAQRQ